MITGSFINLKLWLLSTFLSTDKGRTKSNEQLKQWETKMFSVYSVYQLHEKGNKISITNQDTCSIESKHGAKLGK